METENEPRRIPSFVWRLTVKSGTFYIHVPVEYAKLKGMQQGDLIDLTIWNTMRRPHGERKQ